MLSNINNINVISEKYGIDENYQFKIGTIELGTYSSDNKFFKCSGLNLKSLIFDSYLTNNIIIYKAFYELKYMNIEFNLIENLTIFPPNLKILICGYNKIKYLKNLPQTIKTIIAPHNLIKHIDLINCNNLIELNLSYNNLTNENLLIPKKVNILNISYNKIKYINFKDTEIYNLNADYNFINNIIELPNKLEILSISHNELNYFKLDKYNSIKQLNLANNMIKKLSGNFHNLTYLLISNNLLESLDANFKILKNLYISNNNIKHIDIPNTVKTLCCKNNEITEITLHDHMTNIYLPFDQLKYVNPFNKFIKLWKLGYIHIDEKDEDCIKHLAARTIQRAIRYKMNKNINNNAYYYNDDIDYKKIVVKI